MHWNGALASPPRCYDCLFFNLRTSASSDHLHRCLPARTTFRLANSARLHAWRSHSSIAWAQCCGPCRWSCACPPCSVSGPPPPPPPAAAAGRAAAAAGPLEASGGCSSPPLQQQQMDPWSPPCNRGPAAVAAAASGEGVPAAVHRAAFLNCVLCTCPLTLRGPPCPYGCRMVLTDAMALLYRSHFAFGETHRLRNSAGASRR